MTIQDHVENIARIRGWAEKSGDLWQGMSWKQFAILAEYVYRCQLELDLEHWELEIKWSPCDEDNHATMEMIRRHWKANLRVCREWNTTLTERERRKSIAHELVHLILEPTWQHTVLNFEGILGHEEYELYRKGAEDHLEYAIDRLATIICRLLPEYPDPNLQSSEGNPNKS